MDQGTLLVVEVLPSSTAGGSREDMAGRCGRRVCHVWWSAAPRIVAVPERRGEAEASAWGGADGASRARQQAGRQAGRWLDGFDASSARADRFYATRASSAETLSHQRLFKR